METLLPAGTAIAAVTLTYFMCIRPMRRGHCVGRSVLSASPELGVDEKTEIARLCAEIESLRADVRADATRPGGQPANDTGQ